MLAASAAGEPSVVTNEAPRDPARAEHRIWCEATAAAFREDRRCCSTGADVAAAAVAASVTEVEFFSVFCPSTPSSSAAAGRSTLEAQVVLVSRVFEGV